MTETLQGQPNPPAKRVLFLVSGSGSTALHQINAINNGELNLEIAGVLSSDPQAAAIGKAISAGVPQEDVFAIDPSKIRNADGKRDRPAFAARIIEEADRRGADWLAQMGWTPWTPTDVLTRFNKRITNQHPGLLPDTKSLNGLQVHETVTRFRDLAGRDVNTGAISQWVSEELDQGEILVYQLIPVYPHDTAQTLQDRVKIVEYGVQQRTLGLASKGQLFETQSPRMIRDEGELGYLSEARSQAVQIYPEG